MMRFRNNNIKIIIIAVIVLIISIIAIVMVTKNNPERNPSTTEENTPVIHSKNVNIKTKTITYKTQDYDVDMKYPQFENLANPFNSTINSKIEGDIDYRNTYNSMALGIEDKSQIGKFIYSVTFDRFDCYDYVSIILHRNAQLGSDRKIEKDKIYVINAKDSTQVVLQDVMANKVDYKRKIVECVNDEAFKNNVEIMGGNGLTKLSDTQSFYIKDEKLHIYFEASEIAPASVGSLDFVMPFKFENGVFTY